MYINISSVLFSKTML